MLGCVAAVMATVSPSQPRPGRNPEDVHFFDGRLALRIEPAAGRAADQRRSGAGISVTAIPFRTLGPSANSGQLLRRQHRHDSLSPIADRIVTMPGCSATISPMIAALWPSG